MSADTSDNAEDDDSTYISKVSVEDREAIDTEHHLAAVRLEKNVRTASRSEFAVDSVRTLEDGDGIINCRVVKAITSIRSIKRHLGEHSDQLKDIQFLDNEKFNVVLYPTE